MTIPSLPDSPTRGERTIYRVFSIPQISPTSDYYIPPIFLRTILLHALTMAASHGDLRHLLPVNYKRQITDWLEEDCPSLDYGGFVVGESEGEARLLGKSQVSQILCERLVATQGDFHIHNVIYTNIIHRVSSLVFPSSTRSSPSSAARTFTSPGNPPLSLQPRTTTNKPSTASNGTSTKAPTSPQTQ